MNISLDMDLKLSEHNNKSKPCKICIPFATVRHRHFSTGYHRTVSNKRKHDIMHCLVCKKSHETNKMTSDKKLIIFLGTSTLYGCILDKNVKPQFHLDINTIAGGTLDNLFENYKFYYSDTTVNQVVIIQALLNDVVKFDLNEIFYKMQRFKSYIKSVNQMNKVIFVGPLRPPKLVSFSVIPTIKTNYLNSLFFLETKCAEMTDYNVVFTLKFYGIKLKKQGKSKKFCHIAAHWREKEINQMLHLQEKQRVQAFVNLLQCIQNNCL